MTDFINSLYLAVGPIASLFTRQMHATIQARSFWDNSSSLSSPLSEELRFCFALLQPKFTPGAVIFCDASDYSFGGYRIKLNDQPVSDMFSHSEIVNKVLLSENLKQLSCYQGARCISQAQESERFYG